MRQMDAGAGVAGDMRRRSIPHSKTSDSTPLATRIALSTSDLACSLMGRPGTTEISRPPTLGSLSKAPIAPASHCSSSMLSEVATLPAGGIKSASPSGESLRSIPGKGSLKGEFEEFFASDGVLTSCLAIHNGNVGTLLLKTCQNPAGLEPGLTGSFSLTSTAAQPEDAAWRSSAWTSILKVRGSSSKEHEDAPKDTLNEHEDGNITPGHDQDHRAHNRLKLILGHISRVGQNVAGNERFLLPPPEQSDTTLQGATTGNLALLGHLGHEISDEHDGENAFGAGSSRAQHVLADAAAAYEKHAYRTHPDLLDRSENHGPSRSPHIRCSWARCHQRLRSAARPQTSTNLHMAYPCSYEDCSQHFHCYQDWAEHVVEPHGDGLDDGDSRTPVASETWFSPRLHQRRRW